MSARSVDPVLLGELAYEALRLAFIPWQRERRVAKERSALAEARLCCPILFARPGDYLEHRRDERMQSFVPDIFEYLGRDDDDWLMFRHDCGTGFGDYYGATNGGMRDVINAWPMSEYEIPGKDVYTFIRLPISMCWAFRLMEDDDEDDEMLQTDVQTGAPVA
ncbi:hypothetical protein PPROV_000208800 [Pycnococcus provasolii]|uniref:Uncharacterized protein n=1 Tax=Pycnococcus provasolii TaxID=41880 RepID=A0A830HA76_9CHLO|nr:hypothetical protein PPROV_000208800 [Pycnococcus provasolii]